jgi:hypothetical protein
MHLLFYLWELSPSSEGVCELFFSIKCGELKRVTIFVIYSQVRKA